MRKPTKAQKARAGLRLAADQLLLAESNSHDAAVAKAAADKKLSLARNTMRMALEDAREAGVL